MWSILLLFPLTIAVYVLGTVIYNLFFHPLAKYPGPLPWRSTRLAWANSFMQGKLPHEIRAIHQKYGSVVRTAPDELSFIVPGAWQGCLRTWSDAQLHERSNGI